MSSRSFRRELSLLDTVALGVGSIVGSGIYIVVGEAAKAGPLAAIAAWAISACLIVPIALAYAMCSRIVTVTGGDYVYVVRGLGPVLGAVAGVTMWIAYIYVIAAIARGVARYIVPSQNMVLEALAATAAIWIITAVNIVGVKAGGKLNTFLTIAKILPLIVFVLFVTLVSMATSSRPAYNQTTTAISTEGLPYAIAATLWAYLGFESASTPAEEVKKQNYIFKAIVISIAFVTMLYLAVAAAALMALPWPLLAKAKAPLYEAAKAIGGPYLGSLIYVGAMVSMLGCLAACILSNARRGYALAADGILPRSLATLSTRGVPARMLLLQGAVATCFAIAMNFVSLYLIADFASLIPYLLVAIALPFLYRKYINNTRVLIIALSLLATASSILLMWCTAVSEPETVGIGVALAAIVAVMTALKRCINTMIKQPRIDRTNT